MHNIAPSACWLSPYLTLPVCLSVCLCLQRPYESESDEEGEEGEEPEVSDGDWAMTAAMPDYDFMRKNRVALSQVRVTQDCRIVFSAKEADAVKRYSF